MSRCNKSFYIFLSLSYIPSWKQVSSFHFLGRAGKLNSERDESFCRERDKNTAVRTATVKNLLFSHSNNPNSCPVFTRFCRIIQLFIVLVGERERALADEEVISFAGKKGNPDVRPMVTPCGVITVVAWSRLKKEGVVLSSDS